MGAALASARLYCISGSYTMLPAPSRVAGEVLRNGLKVSAIGPVGDASTVSVVLLFEELPAEPDVPEELQAAASRAALTATTMAVVRRNPGAGRLKLRCLMRFHLLDGRAASTPRGLSH